jgi:hypothetical protein
MFQWAAHHHQGHKTYQKKEGNLTAAVIIKFKIIYIYIRLYIYIRFKCPVCC